MFERAISQTIQRVSRETLHERSLVSLQEILESEFIPDRLKAFFETEVQWWVHSDRKARDANRRFDYAHPELSSLMAYLEQVQARHAQFEREEFLAVLDSAVKLTYNYVCRPQTTLKWYVFRGQPVKPLDEVTIRLNAFVDYPYFRTVFLEWVDRKRGERPTFEAISAAEFERVIRRTDDQILLNCSIEDLLDIMNPLFEFLGEGPRSVIPVDALIVFFDDKNIKRLVDRLEVYRDDKNETIGRDEFVEQLDELLTSAEGEPEADFSGVFQNDELDDVVREHLESTQLAADSRIVVSGSVATEPPPEVPATRVEVSQGSISTPAHTPASNVQASDSEFDEMADRNREIELDDLQDEDPDAWLDGDDPHPIPSVFEDYGDPDDEIELVSDDDLIPGHDLNLELDDDEESVGPPAGRESETAIASQQHDEARVEDAGTSVVGTDPLTVDEEEDEDEPIPDETVARTNGVVQERLVESNAPMAPELLDPTLERKVIKKVFNRDRDRYRSAVERILGATNWKAACQVLDEIFIANDVDPYSRTAIRFTDAVYGRFLPGR